MLKLKPAELSGPLRSYSAFERGIGGAVRVRQLYVRVGDRYAEMGCMVVRPRGQSFLFQLFHGAGHNGRDHIAHHIEIIARLVVSEQDLELHAGLLRIGDCVRFIRFELRELEIEPLEVQLGEIPRLQAIAANIELVLEVVQIVVGELLAALAITKLVNAWRTERTVCCSCAWYCASVCAVVERAVSRRQRRFSPRSNSRETPTL